MDAKGRFIVAMSGSARLVSDDEPLYVISVAAEMAGMHPQTSARRSLNAMDVRPPSIRRA